MWGVLSSGPFPASKTHKKDVYVNVSVSIFPPHLNSTYANQFLFFTLLFVISILTCTHTQVLNDVKTYFEMWLIYLLYTLHCTLWCRKSCEFIFKKIRWPNYSTRNKLHKSKLRTHYLIYSYELERFYRHIVAKKTALACC